MLKSLFLKQMMKSSLKDIPEDQQNKIISAIEKNPNFFESIAREIKAEVDSGRDQMEATISVVTRHQEKLKRLVGDDG
jgi:hypothetical protein